MPPRCDSARHDQEDGATRADDAAISSTRNPAVDRTRVGVRRAKYRAVPYSMTVQAKPASGRPTRGTASRAPPRTRSLG